MISASVVLIVSGIVCLSLAGLIIYKLAPREGKPPAAWTQSDFLSMCAALLWLVVLLAGLGLLVKGIF